jgi:arylformamidase
MLNPGDEGGASVHYFDVTLPIDAAMPIFAGDPPVELAAWSRRSAGAEFDVTALRLGTHTGTHVDAPSHSVDGPAVDSLDLSVLCGSAFVLDLAGLLPQPARIEKPHLQFASGCTRLLLRTHAGEAWSAPATTRDATGLDEEAARHLVACGVRLIGIDRLSVAPAGIDLAIHRVLLNAGIIILEGLDLRHIRQGTYELLCLPLRIAGGDGAPARAVLSYPFYQQT